MSRFVLAVIVVIGLLATGVGIGRLVEGAVGGGGPGVHHLHNGGDNDANNYKGE